MAFGRICNLNFLLRAFILRLICNLGSSGIYLAPGQFVESEGPVAEQFVCPHWVPGQRCKPYFYEHWRGRLALAVVGASIALATPALNCIKALQVSPPAGPIAPLVIIWGILIAGAWLGGIVLAMHREHDLWGSY